MRTRGWSAETWARKARIAPSTLTRAMRKSYDGVTSLSVLHKLATVARVDSPLDALLPDKVLIDAPSEEELFALVEPARQGALRDALKRRLAEYLDMPE